MVRQFLGAHFFPGTPDGSPNRPVIDAALPKMAQQMEVLDRAVAPTGHLVGDAFTLADANLLPILFYLSKLAESAALLDKAPHLKAYLERHLARPSLQATLPPPMPKR
jgi:glutathione S-transferase